MSAETPDAPEIYSVAVVYVTRRYGGPEEGGWWYDHPVPILHGADATLIRVFTDYGEAAAYANEVYDIIKIRNEELPPLDSVLSEGQYAAHIFDGLPHEPLRPHYE